MKFPDDTNLLHDLMIVFMNIYLRGLENYGYGCWLDPREVRKDF